MVRASGIEPERTPDFKPGCVAMRHAREMEEGGRIELPERCRPAA